MKVTSTHKLTMKSREITTITFSSIRISYKDTFNGMRIKLISTRVKSTYIKHPRMKRKQGMIRI